MSVFANPTRHFANPAETWSVVKVAATRWDVCTLAYPGVALESYSTRKEAIAAIETGPMRKLYDQESRWYNGESIPNWRDYKEIQAEDMKTLDRLERSC